MMTYIYNEGFKVAITDNGGNNLIRNSGLNVTINAGEDNDTIENGGTSSIINSGEDNDYINNTGSYVSINGDTGDDAIYNVAGNSATILGGSGNDSIYNQFFIDDSSIGHYPKNVSINGGDDNDVIYSGGLSVSSVTVDGGAGDDKIYNAGSEISINGGAGNDSISNDGDKSSFKTTLLGGAGKDSIVNNGSLQVIIEGGADADIINNNGGSNVTIEGGKGDDKIRLSIKSEKNFIRYTAGDGNDTIWGICGSDTINILADGWTALKRSKNVPIGENDLLIVLHDSKGSRIEGSILLKNARNRPPKITLGESGTSGGGTGGGYGNSSSGGNGGGGGGSSGGTSSGYGGGYSASGSSGSGSTSSSSNGSSSGRGNTDTKKTSSKAVKRNSESYNKVVQNARASKTFTYAGGRRTVSDYRNGDKILFSAEYTDSHYDRAGNFVVNSSSGSLVVKNAVDKVIDLSNANGTPSIKAYAASNAGVIDGRGIAGFEIINGSAGSDLLYAGDGNSQLWGGNDVVSDTLVGGAGVDSFICSKNQGADLVLNAAPKDTICFNDATLNDIVSATENNLAISITFNTGNVVTVRSPEFLSAKFALADGNAYRFNHIARNWQKA